MSKQFPRLAAAVGASLSCAAVYRCLAQCPALAQSPLRDDPRMRPFLDQLMQRMTPEEKIGQLNLAATGFDVTGPVVSKDVRGGSTQGGRGALLHPNTYAAIHDLQALALKTRLKIPLLSGSDVIHGHRPLFPIPLGLAAQQADAIVAAVGGAAGMTGGATGRADISRPAPRLAQRYIRNLVGSISRPVQELKSFQRVLPKRGESRRLTFRLTVEDLRFYNNDLRLVAAPGAFQAFIGGNSRDVQMAAFTLD